MEAATLFRDESGLGLFNKGSLLIAARPWNCHVIVNVIMIGSLSLFVGVAHILFYQAETVLRLFAATFTSLVCRPLGFLRSSSGLNEPLFTFHAIFLKGGRCGKVSAACPWKHEWLSTLPLENIF